MTIYIIFDAVLDSYAGFSILYESWADCIIISGGRDIAPSVRSLVIAILAFLIFENAGGLIFSVNGVDIDAQNVCIPPILELKLLNNFCYIAIIQVGFLILLKMLKIGLHKILMLFTFWAMKALSKLGDIFSRKLANIHLWTRAADCQQFQHTL